MEKNRVKGMLWGLIVGDALGSPIQFSSKDGHPHITEMVPCPVFGLPAGYWTDDGSMAMCIMESFVRLGHYDLKDIANNFLRWYRHGFMSSKEGKAFDIGGATHEACYAIQRGNLVNGDEETQGNGSIMRFAPSYLLARGDKDIMYAISDLTHASERVRRVVDRLAGILDEHMTGRRTSAVSQFATREDVNNSGWAVSSLEAALWAFNTTSTFEDALVAAVNLGGDSDSIGAVCGQIAGAYYGFDAIPNRWVKSIKNSEDVDVLIESFIGALDVGLVRELAYKLHKGQFRKGGDIPYVEHPASVVKMLRDWGVGVEPACEDDIVTLAVAWLDHILLPVKTCMQILNVCLSDLDSMCQAR